MVSRVVYKKRGTCQHFNTGERNPFEISNISPIDENGGFYIIYSSMPMNQDEIQTFINQSHIILDTFLLV